MSFERTTATAVVLGLSTGLLVAGCESQGDSHPVEQTVTQTVTQTATPNSPSYQPPACKAPSAKAEHAVDALLAQPGNPVLDPTKTAHGSFEQRLNTTDDNYAQQDHVTIFHTPAEYDRLSHDFYTDDKLPYTGYLKMDQDFMRKFGVEVSFGKPAAGMQAAGHLPTAKELQSKNAKGMMLDIVRDYSNIPKEYVALSGLKYIYLTAGLNKDMAAFALTQGAHDTYYVDVDSYAPGNTNLHEDYHLLDSALCGSAQATMNDPAFTALNKVDIYTGKTIDNTHISYSDKYIYDASKRASAENTAANAGNWKAYCSLARQDQAEAHQVLSYSAYHPNVVEDKAETGSQLVDPESYDLTGPHEFPVLAAKMRLLLARLYDRNPAVARYLTQFSNRPYVDTDQQHCR